MIVPITTSMISTIIPSPNLNDLAQVSSEIDNDVDRLLHWLQPYFPTSLLNTWLQKQPTQRLPEPSQRIRAAIRSCLKDESYQVEFIQIYISSIENKFAEFFSTFTASSFMDYFNVIKALTTYYNSQLMYLNVTAYSKLLFHRSLNSIFHSHLISSPFLQYLMDFLEESLFEKSTISTSPLLPMSHSPLSNSVVNLIDIIGTLFSIQLTNEVNHILIQLSIQKIKAYIQIHCSGVWNVPLLEIINQFIQGEIYPNFSIILSYSTDSSLTDKVNNIYLYELIKIAHDELVSLRIKEIFPMIAQYPNSTCGLEELHQCLLVKYNHHHYNQVSNDNDNLLNDISNLSDFSYLASYSLKSQSYQRAKLVDTFIEACHDNLLHAGANTIDIITIYTKTIKSFLLIDPKGVLLDKVVRPIRRYLKVREDIVVKLVFGMLDDSDDNELIVLARELRAGDTKTAELPFKKRSNSILDDSLDVNWVPDPIDALPDFKKGKVSDLIESLISIFDSKSIFTNEFTKLFGEKLVNIHDYDTSEIEQHLDLLKLRFGKNEFPTLDIMIRDVQESKLINTFMNPELKLHSSILSHLYWPVVTDNLNLENSSFDVPPIVSEAFEQYKRVYSRQKKGRLLKFLPQLGLVKLDLQFKDKVVHFEVSPDKAAIISLFNEESNELSVDFISKKLNMTPYIVTKGLSFWVEKGVLLELTKTLYIVNEDEDDDYLGTPAPATNPDVSALLPSIKTMLENITQLTFERIRSLLNLTVSKDKFDMKSLADESLEKYLEELVNEGVIEFLNGFYRAMG